MERIVKKLKNILLFIFWMISSSCSIFNAGTVHLKYSDIDAGIEGNQYELKKKLGNISASIRQMEHPSGYERWDYLVKLSPSMHFDRFDFHSTATSNNGDLISVHDLNYKRISGLGNLKFELFTPGGQFVFTAGFGVGIYRLDDDHGLKTTKTRTIHKFDLSYHVFLSDRVFLMMGPRYYKTSFEQFTFIFRLGYFWGDIP